VREVKGKLEDTVTGDMTVICKAALGLRGKPVAVVSDGALTTYADGAMTTYAGGAMSTQSGGAMQVRAGGPYEAVAPAIKLNP
jgi:hypothetical protein